MRALRKTTWLFFGVWTFFVLIELFLYGWNEKSIIESDALMMADGAFEKDILYRRWNSGLGGVYAPVSEKLKPNPYLSDIPERDILTHSGRKLTLVNPTYMTRQMYEIAAQEGKFIGHITSLKPLRPENKPDQWEKKALQTFQRGEKKYYSIEILAGRKVLRYMRPLYVEDSCLTCHAKQGYKKGEVRGGISISIPMQPFIEKRFSHFWLVAIGYGALWLFVCGVLFAGDRESRRKEEILVRSAEEWRTTFDAIPDFVSVMDTEFRILKANKTLSDFLGMDVRDLIGRKCYDLLHKTASPIPYCPLEKAIKNKTAVTSEIDDPTIGVPLLITVAPMSDKEGKIYGFVHIARDISALKKAEDKLRRANEVLEEKVAARTQELETASRQLIKKERLAAIGKVAASVSHDIRNPLGSISNCVYYLKQVVDQDQEDVINHLEIMENEIILCTDIISDLMDITRENVPILRKGSINKLLLDTLKRFRFPDALTIRTVLDPELPETSFDEIQIGRVFYNLINNALHAMPEGNGSLEIISRQMDSCIEIIFKDSGSGINADNLEQIFEPLFTTKAKGVGMGLTIVRNFVEKHGGEIHIESKPGKGSTFTIKLPIVDS